MTDGALLQAEGLQHGYHGRAVLNGVDLAIRAGELVALLGANGAGKSTLLRLLMGFEPAQRGALAWEGRPLGRLRRRELARRLAYVPQQHVPAFPYTVRQLVRLGRLPHHGWFSTPRAADEAVVDRVLERLAIPHLAERACTELSGGERQLALIARCMAQGAALLVLDEPASGLDFGYQMRLLSVLRSLAEAGQAVLMSTHHPAHALAVADRVLLLDQGRIIAAGPPRQVLSAERLSALYGVSLQLLRDEAGRVAGVGPA